MRVIYYVIYFLFIAYLCPVSAMECQNYLIEKGGVERYVPTKQSRKRKESPASVVVQYFNPIEEESKVSTPPKVGTEKSVSESALSREDIVRSGVKKPKFTENVQKDKHETKLCIAKIAKNRTAEKLEDDDLDEGGDLTYAFSSLTVAPQREEEDGYSSNRTCDADRFFCSMRPEKDNSDLQ